MTTPCYVYEFSQDKILKHDECEDTELDRDDIIEILQKYSKKWVFQCEKSDNGYLHYQGRMTLIKKKRQPELIKLMGEDAFTWVRPTVSSEHQKVAFYQMKEDTRIDGPWDDTMDLEQKVVTRQLIMFKSLVMRPYQRDLFEKSTQFDMRAIDLIYDRIGNIGKSIFAEYMESEGLAEEIPPYRLMDDIFQWVCTRPVKKCYILDMPRGMKKDKLGDLYSGIEIIKNGTAYDKRNRAKKIRFDRPRIFVFTNTLPQFDLMSKDRWNVWTINEDYELIPYTINDNIIETDEGKIEIELK